MLGSVVIVLLQFFSASKSEIGLKIGQYLMQLRRTKNVSVYGDTLCMGVLYMSCSDVSELRIKLCRHVGGTLGMSSNAVI